MLLLLLLLFAHLHALQQQLGFQLNLTFSSETRLPLSDLSLLLLLLLRPLFGKLLLELPVLFFSYVSVWLGANICWSDRSDSHGLGIAIQTYYDRLDTLNVYSERRKCKRAGVTMRKAIFLHRFEIRWMVTYMGGTFLELSEVYSRVLSLTLHETKSKKNTTRNMRQRKRFFVGGGEVLRFTHVDIMQLTRISVFYFISKITSTRGREKYISTYPHVSGLG